MALISVLWKDHILLWTGLLGVTSCLLLNQALETFMLILQAGVIMHFMMHRQAFHEVDRELVVPLCFLLLPLIINLLHTGIPNTHYAKNLIWSIFLITSCWILSGCPAKKNTWQLNVIIAILSVFFFTQTLFFVLQKHPIEELSFLQRYVSVFAMFSNIHFFALFAVITLPVTVFCLWESRSPVLKVLLFVCLLDGMFLLLKTGSRPGWLALLLSGLVLVPFVAGRTRCLLALVLVFVPLILYFANVLGARTRIDDLLLNLTTEERVTIWSDAWEMQKNSTWHEWIFGHGLGSFFHCFKPYPHTKDVLFVFPHNFFLELLFTGGIFTMISISVGYFLFYYAMTNLSKKSENQRHKKLAILLICLMTAQFVHTFLTLPFFSSRAIISLGMVIGAGIWLLRQEKQHA